MHVEGADAVEYSLFTAEIVRIICSGSGVYDHSKVFYSYHIAKGGGSHVFSLFEIGDIEFSGN